MKRQRLWFGKRVALLFEFDLVDEFEIVTGELKIQSAGSGCELILRVGREVGSL